MRVLRWAVAIDDNTHELRFNGPVVPGAEACHDGCPTVAFWSVEPDSNPDARITRVMRVFGTGQPIPDGWVWRATTPRLGGLVWHVCEFVGLGKG